MRVFVSHAGRDRAWAEWVGWQLQHAGWDITVELDCWDWQAGDNFVTKMNTALASADRMVAVFSQAYFEPARWTSEEWTAAFRMAKDRPGFLVPVRVDDTPRSAVVDELRQNKLCPPETSCGSPRGGRWNPRPAAHPPAACVPALASCWPARQATA